MSDALDHVRAQLQEVLCRTRREMGPLLIALSCEVVSCTAKSTDDLSLAIRQLAAVSKLMDDVGAAKALLGRSIS